MPPDKSIVSDAQIVVLSSRAVALCLAILKPLKTGALPDPTLLDAAITACETFKFFLPEELLLPKSFSRSAYELPQLGRAQSKFLAAELVNEFLPRNGHKVSQPQTGLLTSCLKEPQPAKEVLPQSAHKIWQPQDAHLSLLDRPPPAIPIVNRHVIRTVERRPIARLPNELVSSIFKCLVSPLRGRSLKQADNQIEVKYSLKALVSCTLINRVWGSAASTILWQNASRLIQNETDCVLFLHGFRLSLNRENSVAGRSIIRLNLSQFLLPRYNRMRVITSMVTHMTNLRRLAFKTEHPMDGHLTGGLSSIFEALPKLEDLTIRITTPSQTYLEPIGSSTDFNPYKQQQWGFSLGSTTGFNPYKQQPSLMQGFTRLRTLELHHLSGGYMSAENTLCRCLQESGYVRLQHVFLYVEHSYMRRICDILSKSAPFLITLLVYNYREYKEHEDKDPDLNALPTPNSLKNLFLIGSMRENRPLPVTAALIQKRSCTLRHVHISGDVNQEVLRALEECELEYLYITTAFCTPEDILRLIHRRGKGLRTLGLDSHKSGTPLSFNATFMLAIARNCPNLEQLKIVKLDPADKLWQDAVLAIVSSCRRLRRFVFKVARRGNHYVDTEGKIQFGGNCKIDMRPNALVGIDWREAFIEG